jgi:hypothetical protein
MSTDKRFGELFDYQARAELFPGKNIRARSRAPKYMRFDHAADAIQFAVEQLPAATLLASYLEVNERRYDCRGIHYLYNRADYPLPRVAKVA